MIKPTFGQFAIALLLIFCVNEMLLADELRKSAIAYRTTEAPIINGSLNEKVWQLANPVGDFTQIRPFNGRSASLQTEVRFLYDNKAIYIGAMLYESATDSIINQLTKRDNVSNTDFFGVYIDPYNDASNGFGFFVTAAGVQTDLQASLYNEDSNWDAVWQSSVIKTDAGWQVEMKIPLSALRFPKTDVQTWGINMFRNIQRKREYVAWNPVDTKITGLMNQAGVLSGISNLTPPTRLSFTPYVSSYVNHSENNAFSYSVRGGMDVKYGLSESFTLDLMLIPDFGQVQSDDASLNLSPFELKYDEKRSFFMEGVELMKRGNILYTKRIGETPKYFNAVKTALTANEIIMSNPAAGRIVNATKLSGKTNGGMSLGFLNGIVANTYAEIKDTLTGETRSILTQPFTNYNLLAMQQTFANNSFFSLVNTNVMQPDERFTANVTASEFNISEPTKTYAFSGRSAFSSRNFSDKAAENGFNYNLDFSKISGNFRYSLYHSLINNTYNPNDMGYLQKNNSVYYYGNVSYNKFTPFWKLINWKTSFSLEYSQQFKPLEFNYVYWRYNLASTLNNYIYLSYSISGMPVDSHDWSEARTANRVFVRNKYLDNNLYISTDYRKKLALDLSASWRKFDETGQNNYFVQISPRLRFSDKILVVLSTSNNINLNEYGYASKNSDEIFFSKRNRNTVTNVIDAGYIFNNKISLSLRARHYWTQAINKEYFSLLENGNLATTANYTGNGNINYNAFNIDLVYVWNFAPGSELSLVWKNSISNYKTDSFEPDYLNNLTSIFQTPQSNSLSLKLIYFVDYQQFKRNS